MEYLGFLLEFMFLGMGVYAYLFAIGKITHKDPERQKAMDDFRQKNGGWIRMLALAIIAITIVNLYLHFVQFFGS